MAGDDGREPDRDFLTARGFLRGLGDREGSLVLVGSTAGIFGEAGHADYAAAKSAILGGLLLSLKNEAVRRNPRTRVNAVAPGWTVTPMAEGHLDPADVARITSTMALKKIATPEEVAAQVVALTSPLISRPRHRPGGHRRRRHGRPPASPLALAYKRVPQSSSERGSRDRAQKD